MQNVLFYLGYAAFVFQGLGRVLSSYGWLCALLPPSLHVLLFRYYGWAVRAVSSYLHTVARSEYVID